MTGLEIRAQIDAETAKALFLLNGGGVIAMLTLLPYLLQRPGMKGIVPAILGGVLVMTFGLLFAVIHNRCLRHCSLVWEEANRKNTKPTPWTFRGYRFSEPRACVCSTVCFWCSLGAFGIAGCLVTAYGLHVLRHL